MLRRYLLIFTMVSVCALTLTPAVPVYAEDAQTQQVEMSEDFRVGKILPVLNASVELHKGLIKIRKAAEGRSFDNLFRELSSLKDKNQSLRMKAAEIVPNTDREILASKELNTMLESYDDYVSCIIMSLEQQQVAQSHQNTNSAEYQNAIRNRDAQIKAANEAEVAYFNHQNKLAEICNFRH